MTAAFKVFFNELKTMDYPNWPPPLPSLPLYPPFRAATPPPASEPELKPLESKTREWWNEYLWPVLCRISDAHGGKKRRTFELTRRQRRELLPVRMPTLVDKLISSVPLPEGSYPPGGLPIWERLPLDSNLPMLKCPPHSLIFARQRIGKKLWKNTEGQEFILYDPNSYEMTFSYENVHDPHLSSYYKGKQIRGFLLRVGDATEDGWGLCSLKKFNQHRKYLKRVYLSLVHSEIHRQEALKDEIHKIKEIKEKTVELIETLEQRATIEEVRATIHQALRQQQVNRLNRVLGNIKEKEERIKKLYKKREKEKEAQRLKGLKLLAEQEMKNEIASEIKRRKRLATLRRWHDAEEKTIRILKRQEDEKARQKVEKVRIRWNNKIENLRKMLETEDKYLKLQNIVREENIKIRNAQNERMMQEQKDRFQEIRKQRLRKKVKMRSEKQERRMEAAITDAWIRSLTKDYDLSSEVYRVKKSINSTMAELLTAQMEGPDRFSIILMSRSRIQREQKIPIQVSFAIDVILETAIQEWAKGRLVWILETVVDQVIEDGRKILSEIKNRYKDIGMPTMSGFITRKSRGRIYKADPEPEKLSDKNSDKKDSGGRVEHPATGDEGHKEDALDTSSTQPQNPQGRQGSQAKTKIVHNYVHFGPVTIHEYPIEYESEETLKTVADRPKTPMPSNEELCKAGFLEEMLNDLLPTLNVDVMDLKEKRKFRKIFKIMAIQLFRRSIAIAEVAFDPVTRFRTVHKLVHLGDTDRTNLTNTLCALIMNKEEKTIYKTEEFEWLTKAVAREAIKEVLNPPEFNVEEGDCVARTKIMFYAPKRNRVKKPL